MSIPKRMIIGIEVQEGEYPRRYSFFEDDILNISMWKPKSNYNIPIFYTLKGVFTVLTTMESCVGAFPAFRFLDGTNLVNLNKVDRVTIGDYGGKAFFRDSELYTGMNFKTIETWGQIIAELKNNLSDDRELLVQKILEKGRLGSGEFLAAEDILWIEMWEPKKNYYVPRFCTVNGCYSKALTFQACKEAFDHFYPAHNGNLVNIDQIDYIDETFYGSTIHFKGTTHVTDIARNKVKPLKDILKNL